MEAEVSGQIISSGLSFGGEKVAGSETGHPAIAPLLAAIAALQRHQSRAAVSQLELAMDLISEHDGQMCEF